MFNYSSDSDEETIRHLLFTRHRSSIALPNVCHHSRQPTPDARVRLGQRLPPRYVELHDGNSALDQDSSLSTDQERVVLRHSESTVPENRSAVLLKRTRFAPIPWEKWYMSDLKRSSIKKKSVRRFYEKQNRLIENLKMVDAMLQLPTSANKIHSYCFANIQKIPSPSAGFESQPLLEQGLNDKREPLSSTHAIVKAAITINFMANFFLLISKLVVAWSSSSLSVTASLVDSALDFTSTIIVYTMCKLIEHRDWETSHNYPVGKNRLEPLGVLVFAVIMIVSFIQVLAEAGTRLMNHREDSKLVQLSFWALMTMISTIVIKGSCWIWCRTINNSGAKALAIDAMNDVVFNTASIAFPLIGSMFNLWWADALGAILISLYIIVEWCNTAINHINNLTGRRAELITLQTIAYLAARFSDHVLKVVAVSAYHSGDNFLVEVDIVLNENMTLRDVHDLAEALQFAIEGLPKVERAFVHSDYSAINPPGHRSVYTGSA